MEWLTTGQMLDRLKDGQEAESDNGFVVKNEKGHVRYNNHQNNGNCVGDYFRITPTTNTKWFIRPNYVTFEKAMKALEEDKTVKYEGVRFSKDVDMEDSVGIYTSWKELFEGKWTIEGAK